MLSLRKRKPVAHPAPEVLPRHVAVIMDGNGRWAKARGLPRTAGHKQGADAARKAVEACISVGIEYLTLYAFSSENWQRSEAEVSELMQLLKFYLDKELPTLHKKGVRLRVSGDLTRLEAGIRERIAKAEALTAANTALHLTIALSYGGRQEIVHAVQALARQVHEGSLTPEAITETTLRGAFYVPEVPDPDLLIRTGGDHRISNFLIWQMAYTELYFTEQFWPDFGEESLRAAVAEFGQRERRFGRADG